MSASAIQRALEGELGLKVSSVTLTAGGDINDAYRAETSAGPLFVKTSATAQEGAFSDEAAGLEWLTLENGLAVPKVIGVCEGPTKLLALEWIERGELDAAGEEALGRGLAHIHLAGASHFGATPCYESVLQGGNLPEVKFNELSLGNVAFPCWWEFYGRNRLIPLARKSHERGALPIEDVLLIERLCERLPELAGPEEPPARIHGDLWWGNVMADRHGTPYLVDPVAHGGHREVDLALLTVFGGPSERCFAAYDEVSPRAAGHEERKQLWQLAMILLHVYLFGGNYVQQARQITASYL